jgi:hypothetical protein
LYLAADERSGSAAQISADLFLFRSERYSVGVAVSISDTIRKELR